MATVGVQAQVVKLVVDRLNGATYYHGLEDKHSTVDIVMRVKVIYIIYIYSFITQSFTKVPSSLALRMFCRPSSQ